MVPSILVAFSLSAILLCLNLLVLWVYSGFVRSKTGRAVNPEDSKAFGATVDPAEPEAVARVLRAHANAQAAIFPFLILALVYSLLGGTATMMWIVCIVFVVARFAHSFVYLRGLQPWRTMSFLGGLIATLVLLVADLIAL